MTRMVRWPSNRAASSSIASSPTKMAVCGAHFPFPGAGSFVKDGTGYAFTPVKA